MCRSNTATPASRAALSVLLQCNSLKHSRIRATCQSLKWEMRPRCTSPTATPASWAAVNLLLVQLSPVQIIVGSGWAKFAESQEHLPQLSLLLLQSQTALLQVAWSPEWDLPVTTGRWTTAFFFRSHWKNDFAPLLPLPRRNSFVWCWWTPPLTRFPASMPASAVPTYSSDSTGPPILRSVASIIHL